MRVALLPATTPTASGNIIASMIHHNIISFLPRHQHPLFSSAIGPGERAVLGQGARCAGQKYALLIRVRFTVIVPRTPLTEIVNNWPSIQM